MPGMIPFLPLCCFTFLTLVTADTMETTVVIIGGGPAGVKAAQDLNEAGVSFILVEAQNVIGGRVKNTKFADVEIQEGAAWIHGTKTKGTPSVYNPIMDEFNKYNMKGVVTDYGHYRWFDRDGNELDSNLVDTWGERLDEVSEFCETKALQLWDDAEENGITNPEPGMDTSIQACYDEFGYIPAGTSAEEETIAKTWQWIAVDFEKTAAAENLSLMNGYPLNGDYIHEDVFITDQRGYAFFLRQIAESFPANSVKLSQTVTDVTYSNAGVTVNTDGGLEVKAKYGICTLPLGVLQKGNVQFDPPFPSDKQDGIQGMLMGSYEKVLMKFETAAWQDTLSSSWCPASRMGLHQPR